LKIPFNIIIPSTPRSSKLSVPTRFLNQTLVALSPIRRAFSSHLTLLDSVTRTIFRKQCRSLNDPLFYILFLFHIQGDQKFSVHLMMITIQTTPLSQYEYVCFASLLGSN
jgi:hypothetical protein